MMSFPWLHSHGPIEAVSVANASSSSVSDFRGYTATAPLKRTESVVRYGNAREFPWLHSHGPIEAS